MSGPARTAFPLACNACGTRFEPTLVFERQGFASCRKCGAVLQLDLPRGARRSLAPRPASEARADLQPKRPDVPMPHDVTVREGPGRLDLTFKVPAKFALWAAAPLGVLIGVGLLYVQVAEVRGNLSALVAVVAPLALAAVYASAAVLLNKLRVTVADGALMIGSGPLPWPGGRNIAARDIQQLYCEEQQVPDEHGSVISRTFGVSAVLKPDGRRLVLVQGLPDAQLAFWLEQALEWALDVRDEPVGGEAQRQDG